MPWFKKKTKNRRLGREQVLEVKLRTSQIRAVRARWAAWGLGGIFGLTFGLLLLWRTGEWALNRFVYTNPSFAVREFDVQTDGVIAVEQLRRWAGVKFEDNLLALDLAKVKRDLELVPLIDSVSVERILPHTLRIRVNEREPIAQIGWKTDALDAVAPILQLDVNGVVLLPLESHQRGNPANQRPEQLTAIVGINPNELRPGRQLESAEVQAALDLLLAFEQSSMADVVELKRIDVSSPGILQITTGQGSEVTFALNDAEQQLRRWREIFDAGQRLHRAVATVDLAVSNNIPARWTETSAAAAPPPKVPKPVHKQKRQSAPGKDRIFPPASRSADCSPQQRPNAQPLLGSLKPCSGPAISSITHV